MKKRFLLTLSSLFMLGLLSCSNNGGGSISTETSSITQSSEETSSSSSLQSSEEVIPTGGDLFVSPDAESIDAKGTLDDPMRMEIAISRSQPGGTLYLLEGTYRFSNPVEISANTERYATSKDLGKTMKPYNNGKVKFDFSSMAWGSANRGLLLNSWYWTVQDIEVFGAGDNGIYIGGSHNLVERCVVHDNGDSGLQLGRSGSSLNSIDVWPSYNIIKNCTSYDNHDPKGEDSDGFACKLTTGVGNVFDGCIAYNNVDDGWDLYTKGDSGPIGPVTLRNCIAFNNGITSGRNTDGKMYGTPNSDGNGFKLGGEIISVAHKVENCIAFNNLACGFTDNSNPGPLRVENCTSYNNGMRDSDASNFDMCRNVDTSKNYYKGLFSYCDNNKAFIEESGMKNYNSKDQYKGTAVDSIFYYGRTMLKFDGVNECDYTDSSLRGEIFASETSPFISTEIPVFTEDIHSLFRDENGDIKLGDFLKMNNAFVEEAFGTGTSIGANLA